MQIAFASDTRRDTRAHMQQRGTQSAYNQKMHGAYYTVIDWQGV